MTETLLLLAAFLVGLVVAFAYVPIAHRLGQRAIGETEASEMGLPWPLIADDEGVPPRRWGHEHSFAVVHSRVIDGQQRDLLACNCLAAMWIKHRSNCIH